MKSQYANVNLEINFTVQLPQSNQKKVNTWVCACVRVHIYIYIPKSTQDLVTTLILGIKEVRFKIPLYVFKKCSRSLHWELLWKRMTTGAVYY